MKLLAVGLLCTILAICFAGIKNWDISLDSHICKPWSRFIRWRIGLLGSVTFQLLLRMLSLFSAVIKKI